MHHDSVKSWQDFNIFLWLLFEIKYFCFVLQNTAVYSRVCKGHAKPCTGDGKQTRNNGMHQTLILCLIYIILLRTFKFIVSFTVYVPLLQGQ